MNSADDSWEKTTVGKWCPFTYGKGLPERDRAGGGVPVFGSNGVVGWHDVALVGGPGIVIGRKGTVGAVEYSPRPFWPIDTTYFVAASKDRDTRFTAALLSNLGLEERNSHSAVPGLSRDDAHSIEIEVPPLSIQRNISAVLGCLNDKVDQCRLVQDTLGDLIIAECHAAFEARPDMGEMTLPEAVKLVNGGAYTKGASGTGRMVVRIKELNSGPSETTVYNNIKVPDDKTVNPGDVLFAWSGSLGVWRWYRDQAIVNQHIFKLIPNEQPVWLGWVHVRDALENFQDIAAGKATTMGHITKDHLVRTKVPKLSAEELAALTQRVQPLWDYQLRMGREVQTLKELRDFLLPRLLSGELRVAAAEEMAEAAS